MRRRRLLALLTALFLLTGLLAVPTAAAYEDTQGHWAQAAIDRWSDAGILQGSGNDRFRPNDPMTRAEMAVVLDRLMDYQMKAQNTFTDVEVGTWYTDAVLGANAAGVLKGTGENTMAPGANITREQAVVLLGRALGIAEKPEAAAVYADAAAVSGYALGYVGGMTEAGILHGNNGRVNPKADITRAEVATILHNAVSGFVAESGAYSEDAGKNVIVNKAGAVLKDMTVSGNLVLAEGIGSGDVILENVKVTGKLIVRGGGEHSIIIRGTSQVGTVVVSRKDGKVRVSVEGGAQAEVIYVDDGSDDVKVEGAVGTLIVENTEGAVEVTGTVENLQVPESAKGAEVKLSSTAKVENAEIAAPETKLTVSGQVSNLKVEETAAGAQLAATGGAKIDSAETAADNVAVTGSGKVGNLTVTGGEGVTVSKDTTVTKVENQGGASVDLGGKDIPTGETGSQTPSSGGGSTGPSYSSVDVLAAPLHDTAEPGIADEDLYASYSASGRTTGTANIYQVTVTASGLKAHTAAAGAGLGYWVGVGIPAPDGYASGAKAAAGWGSASGAPTDAIDTVRDGTVEKDGKTYHTFFFNVGGSSAIQNNGVGYIQIDWDGDGDKAAETYRLDLSGVSIKGAETAAELNALLAGGNIALVKLEESFTVTEQLVVSRPLTLDLNGKTLTVDRVGGFTDGAISVTGAGNLTIKNGAITSENALCLIHVNENTTLTIEDGAYDLTGATGENNTKSDDSRFIRIEDGATANVEGGTFTSTRYSRSGALNIRAGGTLNMTGGTVNTEYGIALFGQDATANLSGNTVINANSIGISGNGTKTWEGYKITIQEGVVINSKGTGLYLPSAGTTEITSASVFGGERGIAIRAGNLTLTNASITAEKARDENGQLENGQSGEVTGALIVGKPSTTSQTGYVGDIQVVISGGTLVNRADEGDSIVIDARHNPQSNTITVTGGENKVVITETDNAAVYTPHTGDYSNQD